MRVVQEFYCNECDGYFRVPLNMGLNHAVVIVCPNKACKHEHHRTIKNGEIVDDHGVGRGHDAKYVEHVVVPPSAYSKEQLFKASRRHQRDGTVLRDPSRDILVERWQEIYGDRAVPAPEPKSESLLTKLINRVKP